MPISETKITTKKRSGAFPGLSSALKEIFITPKWNERVFKILEAKITEGKKQTGRPGMDLWQIFVLAQVRLLKDLSYDDLHHIANYDHLIRQIINTLISIENVPRQNIFYINKEYTAFDEIRTSSDLEALFR